MLSVSRAQLTLEVSSFSAGSDPLAAFLPMTAAHLKCDSGYSPGRRLRRGHCTVHSHGSREIHQVP